MNKEYDYLQEINSCARRFDSRVKDINNQLKAAGCDLIGENSNGIVKLIEADPKKNHHIQTLTKALHYASELSRIYRQYEESERIKLEIGIHARRQTRKAERKDMWILWCQKTVRWIASAALIVLLYSSTVWLSQHYNFIKVPVKDWIATPEKVTAPCIK